MKYNFDEIITRIGTDSQKWESGGHGKLNFNKNSLAFSIADMDFACAPAILSAIRSRVDKKIFGYTSARTAKYFDAICGWFEKRFNYIVEPKNIQLASGVMDGIQDVLRKLIKPGDGILIQQPVYSPFTYVCYSVRANVIINELINNNGNYLIDFNRLEDQLSDNNVKVMLFCSPHNPIGRVWKREELCAVASLCKKHNVILISDEIHCDLIRKEIQHTPIAKLNPENDIITVTSPSKTFNLPGLQLANIFFNNDGIQKIAGTPHGKEFNNPLSIEGVIAAYKLSEDWMEGLLEYIDSNLQFLKEWLEANLPEVGFLVPEGTYLAWLDFRKITNDCMEFCQICADKYNIILEPGIVFGESGKGFIRINVATPKSILNEGLKRLLAAAKSLKEKNNNI